MSYILGNGFVVDGGTLIPAGTTITNESPYAGMLPPPDAVALDVWSAVLMWLRYRGLRHKLVRRLGDQEQFYQRVLREFPITDLEIMWGLKPWPVKIAEAKNDFAQQLGAALEAKRAR